MSDEAIDCIAEMVVELTKMRQKGCEHLAIENFSPQLFAKLLMVYMQYVEGRVFSDQEWRWVNEGNTL